MSLDEFIDRLGEETDRRRFIGKIGVAALGVAGGVLGFPRQARATTWGTCDNLLPPCGSLYHYKCCCLAHAPTSCSCSNAWCWACCGANCLTGERWACCECYNNNPPCSYAYIYDYSCTKCQKPGSATTSTAHQS